MHEQQVNSATKAVLDLVQNTETLRYMEPPPILGNSCNTDRTWEAVKMLRKELGLCDVEKEDSTHVVGGILNCHLLNCRTLEKDCTGS